VITTFRCISVNCRIETYKGTFDIPLSACPMCQTIGVAQQSAIKPDPECVCGTETGEHSAFCGRRRRG
jgi:hypothetical protein